MPGYYTGPSSGGSGVPSTLVDAKGDLLVGTADNTVARKASGSNGQDLVADSGQTDGLRWRSQRLTNVVLPEMLGGPFATSVTAVVADYIWACRVYVPTTGTLKDLCAFVYDGGGFDGVGIVFDVGETTSGSYTKLWDSGSVALGSGGNAWFSFGNPDLSVTAGQRLVFGFIASGGAQIGRNQQATGAVATLPANFAPGTGIAAQLYWIYANGSLTAPSAIADASVDKTNNSIYPMIARVV